MPGCRLAGSCRLGRSPVAHGPVPTATAADLPDFCPSLYMLIVWAGGGVSYHLMKGGGPVHENVCDMGIIQ